MTKTQFLDAIDKFNTVEFLPFMIGITWIVMSVVGVVITWSWIVVSLVR